jgi:UrcA family protein
MQKTRLNPLWASLLTISAACAISTPALARTDGIKMSKLANGDRKAEVYHGDLDLSTIDGRRSLEKRVSLAVSRVCQRGNESWEVEKACRRQTSRATRPLVVAAIDRSTTRLAMISTR